jgi:hypothetical protein
MEVEGGGSPSEYKFSNIQDHYKGIKHFQKYIVSKLNDTQNQRYVAGNRNWKSSVLSWACSLWAPWVNLTTTKRRVNSSLALRRRLCQWTHRLANTLFDSLAEEGHRIHKRCGSLLSPQTASGNAHCPLCSPLWVFMLKLLLVVTSGTSYVR